MPLPVRTLGRTGLRVPALDEAMPRGATAGERYDAQECGE
jgi:hypothetical protein